MTAVAVGYGYMEVENDHRDWSADLCVDTAEELTQALLSGD
ncbi:hypothetical protein A8U91_00743 [Halomonas elongata]|nr:hypothetical protein A8U91_00743 [Halomonas elongata]